MLRKTHDLSSYKSDQRDIGDDTSAAQIQETEIEICLRKINPELIRIGWNTIN